MLNDMIIIINPPKLICLGGFFLFQHKKYINLDVAVTTA